MTIARFKDDKELVAFARKFFANRVETFRKDIAICLTPNERGQHAYFPALIICIAFAELLSGLYAGTLRDQKLVQLQEYAKEFMKPEYTSDRRRLELLWVCLRHKVAHLAYPYAVFDTHSEPKTILHGQPRRRVRVLAKTHDPNRVMLIERNIDNYLKTESSGKERSLDRLRVAIHNEEAERREGDDWSIAKDYVRSLLRRMT
jgi:hypothetical protein